VGYRLFTRWDEGQLKLSWVRAEPLDHRKSIGRDQVCGLCTAMSEEDRAPGASSWSADCPATVIGVDNMANVELKIYNPLIQRA